MHLNWNFISLCVTLAIGVLWCAYLFIIGQSASNVIIGFAIGYLALHYRSCGMRNDKHGNQSTDNT